jgi:hypothetical protein
MNRVEPLIGLFLALLCLALVAALYIGGTPLTSLEIEEG